MSVGTLQYLAPINIYLQSRHGAGNNMKAIIICILVFFACQSSPQRPNYPCDECYVASDFLYRMKGAQDKAAIVPMIESCRDAMKERRYIERMKFCKTPPAGITERECMLMLNQR